MADNIERTYTIPLRREYLKVPRYRRTEKASRALREFLIKHMKSDSIKIGKDLNEHLWMHGMKNPPSNVKVNCAKVEGVVYAELFGKQLKIGKEEKDDKKEKTALEKAVEKVKGAVKEKPKEEKKAEEKKEVKKESSEKKSESKKEEKPKK